MKSFLSLFTAACVLVTASAAFAESLSITVNQETIDNSGVYPKMLRDIQVEEAGVTRTIEQVQGNQYVAKSVKVITEGWDNLGGFCDKGDVALSAKCTFSQSVGMIFLLQENKTNNQIMGISCEFDTTDQYLDSARNEKAELLVTCQKQ